MPRSTPARAPLVSVVMPVHNAASRIGAAVRSIREQTLRDWELVAVNDGSTDGTGELLESLARAEPRLRVLHSPRRGIVAALQQGLEQSRGPWVARMDADDVSFPDRLAAQAEYLRRRPGVGLVGCRIRFGGDANAQRGYALHVDWLNRLIEPDAIRLNRFIESPFAHPSVMFRRNLVARLGGYRPGPFPEDYELWLRWLEAGVVMAKLEAELLCWNDPPDRLSRVDPRYASEAFYAVKAGYLARAIEAARTGRSVWVWGAGRPTRRRADHLLDHGIRIEGYIDIDPRKTSRCIHGRRVVGPESIPAPRSAVVVGYVSKRGARELIRARLQERGFVEGTDFWMAA